jgi:hypothetical protein
MLVKRSNKEMSFESSLRYFSTSSISVDGLRLYPSRKRFFFGDSLFGMLIVEDLLNYRHKKEVLHNEKV